MSIKSRKGIILRHNKELVTSTKAAYMDISGLFLLPWKSTGVFTMKVAAEKDNKIPHQIIGNIISYFPSAICEEAQADMCVAVTGYL